MTEKPRRRQPTSDVRVPNDEGCADDAPLDEISNSASGAAASGSAASGVSFDPTALPMDATPEHPPHAPRAVPYPGSPLSDDEMRRLKSASPGPQPDDDVDPGQSDPSAPAE